MLINSLFQILQELLPWCFFSVAASILLKDKQLSFSSAIYGSVAGLIIAMFIMLIERQFSLLFDGRGLELLFLFLVITPWLCYLLFIVSTKQKQQASLVFIIWLCMTTSVAINLLSYATIVIQSSSNFLAPVLGTLVGLGLSISLAILWYFSLNALYPYSRFTVWFLAGFVLCGQFANEINLLAQIGLVESEQLWTSRHILSDETALGHILKGLVGYEATPIRAQGLVYSSSITLLIALLMWRKKSLFATHVGR